MAALKLLTETFIPGLGEAGGLPPLALAPVGEPIKTAGQVRAEWLRKRLGKFTASEAHRLMANGKTAGELSAGAKTYATEKAVECLTEFDPEEARYIGPAMQWGIDHEHEAVEAFMEMTGINVKNHGREQVFVEFGPDAGGTPDGTYPGGGVEIKCPSSKAHMEHFDVVDGEMLKAIAPAYYWQCQMLMLITGANEWQFVSFDPRFKDPRHRLHIALIEPSQPDIDLLIDRLDMAIRYRDGILGRFSG